MKISEVENILQNVQNCKTCLIECDCDEFYAVTSISKESLGRNKGQYLYKISSRDKYDYMSPGIDEEKILSEDELRISLLDFNLEADHIPIVFHLDKDIVNESNQEKAMIMELHPYDGRDRRFRHTDVPPTTGLVIVARLLHLNELPSQQDIFYDLSFYSGGMGILDRLAIALPADTNLWKSVKLALRARTLEEACQDESWAEDLLWLIDDDDGKLTLPHEAAARFINSKRQTFQPRCVPTNWLYFEEGSNINDWKVLWE